MTGNLTVRNTLTLPLVAQPDAPTEPHGWLTSLTGQMSEGSDDAWREFHGRYYLPLLRYASARVACPADAPEVVQQSYLRIARHIKVFSDEARFWRWLMCVVRCVATDHRRGAGRRARLLEKFSHWQEAKRSPNWSPVEFGWSNSVAQDALAKLPSEEAQLLRLKYCEGWSVQQLAAEMNTTSKAMESRLARLRQRLRELILRIQ